MDDEMREASQRQQREWVRVDGYSMRGPVPHVHAEVRDLQRREEEKYAQLIAETLGVAFLG